MKNADTIDASLENHIKRPNLWNSVQGCGVGDGGVACFQLDSESGVRVGFLKLLESES